MLHAGAQHVGPSLEAITCLCCPGEQEQDPAPQGEGAAGPGRRPVDGSAQRAPLRGLPGRLHPLQVTRYQESTGPSTLFLA